MNDRRPYVAPPSSLPDRTDLAQLTAQARAFFHALRGAEVTALDLLRRHHPAFSSRTAIAADELALADAQLTLARHWGHPSWARLKQDVGWLAAGPDEQARQFVVLAAYNENGPSDAAFRAAVRLFDAAPSIAEGGLYPALVLGRRERIRQQIEHDPMWAKSPGGPYESRQPLHYVTFSSFHCQGHDVADGLLDCARMLLEAGADPSASFTQEGQGDHAMSALYGACGVTNFPAMAELLLERGADTNDGESLYHSLEFTDLRCCELLLACGVQTEGTNALNHSLDFADPTATVRLLEHGADPNEVNDFNHNPLDWAITRGREVERLRVLIEYGADPLGPREPDGLTPYQVAVQTGHSDAAEHLASIGAACELSPLARLIHSCTNGTPDGRVLATNPSLFDGLSTSDTDTLLLLAERGRTETLRHLYAQGLPVDLANHRQVTALHLASWHGEAGVVEVLIQHGAPLEAVEREFGCTPLGWAAHGCTNWPNLTGDYLRVMRLLLSAGADPNAPNAWGEHPIDLAGPNREVADLLWAAGGRARSDLEGDC